MQWISVALGTTVNVATGSKNTTGAMVAQYGTKWNYTGPIWKSNGELALTGAYLKLMR